MVSVAARRAEVGPDQRRPAPGPWKYGAVTVTEDTPFTPEDDTYHPASDDPYWTETTWWSLNIPERRMGAWLHAAYHANRGAVTWRVFLWDPAGADPGRLAYYKQAGDVPMG